MNRSARLLLASLIASALVHVPAAAGERIEVVGVVIGVVWPEHIVVSGIGNRPCEDRLLFRITDASGAFRPGDHLVLQYDKPPHPCELPAEMLSGKSVWKFKLSSKPAGEGPMRVMLRVQDRGKETTADTPYGRLTLARYGNLTMLNGERIEDLPLDVVIREYRFAPESFERRHEQ